MTSETKAPGARGLMLVLSSPGAILCAMVPLGRLLFLETSPDQSLGAIVRFMLFGPWVLFTFVGLVTPLFCPVVLAIAIYRVGRGDFRGVQFREALACAVASIGGIYMWFVLVAETLHGHMLPMFPWDPAHLSLS